MEGNEAQSQVVRYLARAMEIHYPSTAEHLDRVSATCAILADELGLDAPQAELIAEASVLHDVGNIGVPNEILAKEDELTRAERDTMERHTALGHELLSGSGVALLDMAAEIALTHHERFNGIGYPHGLRGDEIPISGRLVAVADVFEALTTDRAHRPAFPVEHAADVMEWKSGNHFDPGVYEAFSARFDDVLAAMDELSD